MNIALFASTPAQYHFYMAISRKLREEGHEVTLMLRDYGETLSLLGDEDIERLVFSRPSGGMLGTLVDFPLSILKASSMLRGRDILLVSGFGIYNAIVSRIIGCHDVVFLDSEPGINRLMALQHRIFSILTDTVIVPIGYRDPLEKKMVRIGSVKEMAYLGSSFHPDASVLSKYGVEPGEYVLIRFNAFDAAHDVGISGFSQEEKLELLWTVSQRFKIVLSVENRCFEDQESVTYVLDKKDIHQLIYHAKCLITDTQTIATESAILGTPAIRSNSFVRGVDMGVFRFFEERYGILFNEPSFEGVIERFEQIAATDGRWKEIREAIVADLGDVSSAFIREMLGSYGEEPPETATAR